MKSEVRRPKLHRSLDDLKAEKTQDVIHSRELQFLQTVKVRYLYAKLGNAFTTLFYTEILDLFN